MEEKAGTVEALTTNRGSEDPPKGLSVAVDGVVSKYTHKPFHHQQQPSSVRRLQRTSSLVWHGSKRAVWCWGVCSRQRHCSESQTVRLCTGLWSGSRISTPSSLNRKDTDGTGYTWSRPTGAAVLSQRKRRPPNYDTKITVNCHEIPSVLIWCYIHQIWLIFHHTISTCQIITV